MSSSDNPKGRSFRTFSALETETLPPLSTRTSAAPPDEVVGLTILCHPDPSRIGEQARYPILVYPGTVDLSRSEPLFRPPGSGEARPLLDPYVSRKPVELTRTDSGTVEIGGALESSSVDLDGSPLTSTTTVPDSTAPSSPGTHSKKTPIRTGPARSTICATA